jgi:HD-GYP domain-containing protein (c-di-GMP phosphodiesterase class II)
MKWAELSTTLLLGLFLIWFIPRPHSAIAGFLKTVPRASMWLTLAINFMLVTLGFIVFVYLGVLFDASSFFLIISAIMGSLISSALIEIDRQASALAAQQQQMSEVANFAAGRFSLMLTEASSAALTAEQAQVSEWVRLLARRVAQNSQLASQLDTQDIELISRAAPHRDIGMLYVPRTTTGQTGDISVRQRETLQQHTRVGGIAVGKVLASLEDEVGEEPDTTIRYLQILKKIAEGHHERWDGSGYPQGTAGDATPLCARIVALIDCYDSLLQDRPYRSALDPQTALSIITQGSGTQFDERLVDAFVAVVPDFR